jgi:hypothetical protein
MLGLIALPCHAMPCRIRQRIASALSISGQPRAASEMLLAIEIGLSYDSNDLPYGSNFVLGVR